MTKALGQRLLGVLGAIVLCAGGPQSATKGTRKHESTTGRWTGPVYIMAVNSTEIHSAYITTPVSGALDSSCNTDKSGTMPALKIVRLHIQVGMLGNLSNGIACVNCLEIGKAMPRTVSSGNAIDDDAGGSTPLPAAGKPPANPPIGDYTTRLDVALTKDVWRYAGAGNNPILLKIVLDDPNMTFIRAYNGKSNDAVDAVRYGIDPNKQFDCRQPIMPGAAESVEFRVKYPGTTSKVEASLNIGVSVNDPTGNVGFTLPIILDPKVPNNG